MRYRIINGLSGHSNHLVWYPVEKKLIFLSSKDPISHYIFNIARIAPFNLNQFQDYANKIGTELIDIYNVQVYDHQIFQGGALLNFRNDYDPILFKLNFNEDLFKF